MEKTLTPGATSINNQHQHFLPNLHLTAPARFRIQFGSVKIPHLKSRFATQISSGVISVFNGRMPNFKTMDGIRFGILRSQRPRCSSGGEPESRDGGVSSGLLAASTITIFLAIANRVLYKLALVPMKEYPFFMAQLTTFGYVAIYFSILYARYKAGIVTKEMLGLPKSRFAAIGFLEALGVASGMSAAAMLPGAVIPILSQTFTIWQLIFSAFILGRRYSLNQILGCLLVAGGVVIAVGSGADDGHLLSQVGVFWPVLMIVSTALQATASILKEFVFTDSAKRLEGKTVDLFVVNSFGSGFQAAFIFLLLPLLSNLKGIPFFELPSYFRSGIGCFLNIGAANEGCQGAPWLPMLYIAVNMCFNISALNLLKVSSALVSSLSITLSVPLSIYILTLPLPFMPGGSNLDAFFVTGVLILVLGLMLYNFPQSAGQRSKSD